MTDAVVGAGSCAATLFTCSSSQHLYKHLCFMKWESWGSDIAVKLFPQDWTRNLWPVWQGSSGIFFAVSHARSSFLAKAWALKVNLSVGSFAAPWQNNEQLCIMWRRTCQKLTLQCGRRRRYHSLLTLETLSPVRVGVWSAEIYGYYCLLWQLSHSLLKTSQWNCFHFTWGGKMLFFPLIVEWGRA